MKTLIRSALVLSPGSPHHLRKRDLLIDGGMIREIGTDLSARGARVIEADDLCVSAGWTDLRANFRDPGHEYKENLRSGSQAALAGGFRRVVLMPSTSPPVDSKAAVEYITRRNAQQEVELLPTGCLSEKGEGKQLAEFFDMHEAGAAAFTDDKANVSTELMARALEYARNFDGLVMSFPLDRGVNPGGMVHEGPTSTAMGVKGLSSLSEELRLQRDIELLRYTGGRLHVSLISTARSVDLIRKAKKEGLRITCAIAAHQLFYLDKDLIGFDSNKKVLPPFRGELDRKALIRGLMDGTIDAICSDHSPEDTEHKELEFEYASYGISSIQVAFPVALTAVGEEVDLETLVAKFTSGPAAVLGRTVTILDKGMPADITVFSPEQVTWDTSQWKSLSRYSPFLGETLVGRIYPTGDQA